ncbi:MAG: methyltransferase domain-containing protein [Burkholderiaceae bacterium]
MSVTNPVHRQPEPDPWILAWLARLPAGARVLDFACGSGRHARAAAALGLTVVAIDADMQALASVGEGIAVVRAELEVAPWPFAEAGFDAVIVSNYLFRSRLDLLCGLIRPTGVLLYQTFAVGNESLGRPRNPDFLLRPGELLEVAARNGLHVLAYEDGILGSPARARIQRIVACRPLLRLDAMPLGA